MATVRIPPILRPEADGKRELDLEGDTVREVLEALVDTYPSLRSRILPANELPQFLNVFADGSDIRLAQGLDTPVGASTALILLPAVAGGRAQTAVTRR
jgi:sulfur-carrier protein